MTTITPSPNTARSWARELSTPAVWRDDTARRVYDAMQGPVIVDMWITEKHPRSLCEAWPATPRSHKHVSDVCNVCAGLRTLYSDRPHVIAYRMWDVPGPREDAQDYIVRHIARAAQTMGAVVWP